MPLQLILVLNNTEIIATNSFPSSSLGMIIANNAHFSNVVSPGGTDRATINCGNVIGPAGIYIFNSSYFSIDGITVKNCGSNLGAISILGLSDRKQGNSTSILNSKITNSTGHGIYTSLACRVVVYKNSILSSAKSGIYISNSSWGAILTGNVISDNLLNGISLYEGVSVTTIRGNIIYGNSGSGINISNTNSSGASTMNVIITNQIIKNSANSMVLSVDDASVISNTVIGGNTIYSNKYGFHVVDPLLTGIQNTMMVQNDDKDGIMSSFLELTNGNAQGSDKRGNYFLDPLNR